MPDEAKLTNDEVQAALKEWSENENREIWDINSFNSYLDEVRMKKAWHSRDAEVAKLEHEVELIQVLYNPDVKPDDYGKAFEAGRRLGIYMSEGLGDWWVGWSPRNSSYCAEGVWADWVVLANWILAQGK